MTTTEAQDHIAGISVSGLFGRFNHHIKFAPDTDLTIITAPNGYGKTVVLRALDAFFNENFSFFWKTDYREIRIEFASGASVSVHRDKTTLFDDDPAIDPVSVTSTGFGDDNNSFHFGRE